MANERVVIAIDGDPAGWDAALDDVERHGKQTARDIDRAFKSASTGVKASFKDVKGALGAAFGGVVNDVEDVVSALGALGPMAGAAAIGIAGAGGLTYALYQAANASGELNDEQARLSEAMADLASGVGAYVAPAFEAVINTMAGVVESLKFGVLGFQLLAEIATRSAGVVVDKAVAAFDILIDQVNHWGTSLKLLASGDLAGFDAEVKRHSVSTREMVSAYAEVPDVLGDSLMAIHPTWQALAGLEATTGKVATTTPKAAAAIRDAAKATAEWSAEVQVLQMTRLEDQSASSEALASFQADLDKYHDEQMANITEEREAARSKTEEQIFAGLDLAQSTISMAAMMAEAIADGAEEGSAAQKRAAMAAFAIQKAAAIGQIALDTGAAVMAAAAAFAFPSPPGIAAVATVAALGLVQAAMVAATPPPQVAHVGAEVGRPGPIASASALAPDEVMVRARRGEAVVPRGTGSSVVPTTVVMSYNHRVFDTADADRSRMSNNPFRRLAMAGKVAGHR